MKKSPRLARIVALVKKDLLLEVRQQYTMYGIVLYVASTIFVIYLSMGQPDSNIWNGLFWITQLFVCVNAVAKSFLQEGRGRLLYFYSIAGPVDFILGKLFFNALLMLAISLISLAVFMVLLGNPLINAGKFIIVTVIGGTGLSLVFTFLAAIAAKAQQSTALMAILGFPIIIPQLLLLLKATTPAFSSALVEGWQQMLILLISFDGLIIALALVLFPFLWKD